MSAIVSAVLMFISLCFIHEGGRLVAEGDLKKSRLTTALGCTLLLIVLWLK